MDFLLNEEQEEMRELFRKFAQNEVAKKAIEIDEKHEFPRENVKKMQELGFFGIPIPEEEGGIGLDNLTYALCIEELAKACASTAIIVSVHTSLACGSIHMFGTKEQKEKYLRPLASGKSLGAFALTEPNAGTDASGLQTFAKKDGDNYILNGSKIFITNAKEADTYIVVAMTDKEKSTRGISTFIVEKGMEGFSFGTKEKKMGIHASSTYELIFQDCKVPKQNLLGKEGQGFKIAMAGLDGARIGVAAQALGIAQGAMDKTIKYVKERKQFGKAIGKFQNISFTLAELEAKIEAVRLQVYKAAWCKDQGKNYGVEAAKAKLLAASLAMEVTTKCVQIHGGYGYIQEYEVERMMRDAKITEIYEGTSEVMKMVIAGDLLK